MKKLRSSNFKPDVQMRIAVLMELVTLYSYDAERRTRCVDVANALAVNNPGDAAVRAADKVIEQMRADVALIPSNLLAEIQPFISGLNFIT